MPTNLTANYVVNSMKFDEMIGKFCFTQMKKKKYQEENYIIVKWILLLTFTEIECYFLRLIWCAKCISVKMMHITTVKVGTNKIFYFITLLPIQIKSHYTLNGKSLLCLHSIEFYFEAESVIVRLLLSVLHLFCIFALVFSPFSQLCFAKKIAFMVVMWY